MRGLKLKRLEKGAATRSAPRRRRRRLATRAEQAELEFAVPAIPDWAGELLEQLAEGATFSARDQTRLQLALNPLHACTTRLRSVFALNDDGGAASSLGAGHCSTIVDPMTLF